LVLDSLLESGSPLVEVVLVLDLPLVLDSLLESVLPLE
jgi:hypothetical protein